MKKEIIQNIKSIIFALVLVIGVSYVSAYTTWLPPTAAPVGNNPDAPIYVGSSGQSKIGGLTLNTGGATNGLIVENGKVGIGTTTPQHALDISSSGSETTLGLLNTSGSPGAMRLITAGGVNYIQSGKAFSNNSSADLKFTSIWGGTTWMTIKSSGNVGIGTDSPTEKLEVNGNIKANMVFNPVYAP